MCNNCTKTNRKCEGYGLRLFFDINRSLSKSKKTNSKKNELKIENEPIKQSSPVQDMVDPQLRLGILTPAPLETKTIESQAEEHKSSNEENMTPMNIKNSNKNLEQFGALLFEDLENLINSTKFEAFSFHNSIISDMKGITPGFNYHEANESNEDNSMISKNVSTELADSNVNDSGLNGVDQSDSDSNQKELSKDNVESLEKNESSLYSLSYEEENMMLRHFFKNLLPLLDAHPNSPWPDLALKYCDFDIARSCFISLACIHIYESRKGGNEYYKKGMAHINNTMGYLIRYIASDNSQFEETLELDNQFKNIIHREKEKGNLGNNESQEEEQDSPNRLVSSFVILVLINVHLLFAVLEKGVSSVSKFFFKVFATICENSAFYESLMRNDKKRSLVVVLSWYDTVSAIVSPECRLPFTNPEWYGSKDEDISTLSMMGCPGEVFRAMAKVCVLRHELYNLEDDEFDVELIQDNFDRIKIELFNYRDYIPIGTGGETYILKLKGAQCWSLAVYVTLLRTVKPENWEKTIEFVLHEFIDVYGSMDPLSPTVTQMVWPVYAMGCACRTPYEKSKLTKFMDTLYRNAQMGTLHSLRNIVNKVWEEGKSQEEVLTDWLDEGVEYLPL